MRPSTRTDRAPFTLLVAGALLASACGSALPPSIPPAPPIPPPPPPSPKAACAPPAAPAQETEDRYRQSIFDAAVYHAKAPRELVTVTTPTVTAVAWVRSGIYKKKGKTPIPKDIWPFVTIVPEVKTRCAAFSGDKTLRLQQLLGLPPGTGATREFVTMKVQTKDLFRPCTDPDPSKKTCAPEFADDMLCLTKKSCGKLPPKELERREAHVEWLARWSFGAWKTQNGYPFTHLGYTYDWAPDAPADHYGASEFVIRAGSEVEVEDITPIDTYCQAKH